jgi:hypothetical protein
MIRPFTCISVLLAFGSGLYVFQTKHQAQVLDRQIEHTVKLAAATRVQTRELVASWTILGSPDRLQQLSDQFLTIKPVAPSQFVAMADLDSRLPAPRPVDTSAPAAPSDAGSDAIASAAPASTPATSTPPSAPGMVATGTAATGAAPSGMVASTDGSKPDSSRPDTTKVDAAKPDTTKISVATRPADHKPAETPHPVRDAAQQAPTPPALTRAPTPRAASRPPVMAELDPSPRPVTQHVAAPVPMTGSLLGMAHGGVRPPVPLPVSTPPPSFNGN